MGYEAYVLTDHSRMEILRNFPPKFPDVIAHHITLAHGVPMRELSTYGTEVTFETYGYICDDGLETVLVKPINGSPIRPNGQRYHVTLSLDRAKGRKPVQSNELISKGTWSATPLIRLVGVLQYLR